MIINFFSLLTFTKLFYMIKEQYVMSELIKLFCNAKAKYVDICPHIYMYY